MGNSSPRVKWKARDIVAASVGGAGKFGMIENIITIESLLSHGFLVLTDHSPPRNPSGESNNRSTISVTATKEGIDYFKIRNDDDR